MRRAAAKKEKQVNQIKSVRPKSPIIVETEDVIDEIALQKAVYDRILQEEKRKSQNVQNFSQLKNN